MYRYLKEVIQVSTWKHDINVQYLYDTRIELISLLESISRKCDSAHGLRTFQLPVWSGSYNSFISDPHLILFSSFDNVGSLVEDWTNSFHLSLLHPVAESASMGAMKLDLKFQITSYFWWDGTIIEMVLQLLAIWSCIRFHRVTLDALISYSQISILFA